MKSLSHPEEPPVRSMNRRKGDTTVNGIFHVVSRFSLNFMLYRGIWITFRTVCSGGAY